MSDINTVMVKRKTDPRSISLGGRGFHHVNYGAGLSHLPQVLDRARSEPSCPGEREMVKDGEKAR